MAKETYQGVSIEREITIKDFEFAAGRKPKSKAEFDRFIECVDETIEQQLDWAEVMNGAYAMMEDD